jgi:hypothetical protein
LTFPIFLLAFSILMKCPFLCSWLLKHFLAKGKKYTLQKYEQTLFFIIIFGGTEVWTQGFALTKLVLCHLNYASSPEQTFMVKQYWTQRLVDSKVLLTCRYILKSWHFMFFLLLS